MLRHPLVPVGFQSTDSDPDHPIEQSSHRRKKRGVHAVPSTFLPNRREERGSNQGHSDRTSPVHTVIVFVIASTGAGAADQRSMPARSDRRRGQKNRRDREAKLPPDEKAALLNEYSQSRGAVAARDARPHEDWDTARRRKKRVQGWLMHRDDALDRGWQPELRSHAGETRWRSLPADVLIVARCLCDRCSPRPLASRPFVLLPTNHLTHHLARSPARPLALSPSRFHPSSMLPPLPPRLRLLLHCLMSSVADRWLVCERAGSASTPYVSWAVRARS